MKEKVAVVIPYYHSQLSELEQISFKQCLKVLFKYPIILIVPDTMEESEYPNERDLIFIKVPSQWLKSVSTYNRMMLDTNFYNIFCGYEYILLYQLDAFVFRDELMKFCEMGYDYIGAPWPLGTRYYKDIKHCIWDVGNGGFSLRNVEASLAMLKKNPADTWNLAEDIYWATCDSSEFHVAPKEIAVGFSIELFVRKMFELNQKRLPFGCHAWEKRDFSFWRPYFEREGYYVSGNMVDEEDKRFCNRKKDILNISIETVGRGLKRLVNKDVKQIYVWGAGAKGKDWILFFRHAGFSVKCVDNNKEKWGKYLWDVPIESPEILQTMKKGALVIIAVKKYGDEIKKQLTEMGGCQEYELLSYEAVQKFISGLQNEEDIN